VVPDDLGLFVPVGLGDWFIGFLVVGFEIKRQSVGGPTLKFANFANFLTRLRLMAGNKKKYCKRIRRILESD